MQDIVVIKNSKNAAKRMLSVIYTSVLAAICILLVLSSALLSSIAFLKAPENTAQLFGYKFFYCENDLSEPNIKGGSLVIVKNSDDDEFYTPQSLSKNAVLVIPGAGKLILENGVWIILCFSIPLSSLFLILLLSELKKLFVKSNQNKMQVQLEIAENNEVEEIYEKEISL